MMKVVGGLYSLTSRQLSVTCYDLGGVEPGWGAKGGSDARRRVWCGDGCNQKALDIQPPVGRTRWV